MTRSKIAQIALSAINGFRSPDIYGASNASKMNQELAHITAAKIIEECARVCDGLRRKDYSAETEDWSTGTMDCGRALRALAVTRPHSNIPEK